MGEEMAGDWSRPDPANGIPARATGAAGAAAIPATALRTPLTLEGRRSRRCRPRKMVTSSTTSSEVIDREIAIEKMKIEAQITMAEDQHQSAITVGSKQLKPGYLAAIPRASP